MPEDARRFSRARLQSQNPLERSLDTLEEEVQLSENGLKILDAVDRAEPGDEVVIPEEDFQLLIREHGFAPNITFKELIEKLRALRNASIKKMREALEEARENAIMSKMGLEGIRNAEKTLAERGVGKHRVGNSIRYRLEKSKTPSEDISGGAANDTLEQIAAESRVRGMDFDKRLEKHQRNVTEIIKEKVNPSVVSDGGVGAMVAGGEDALAAQQMMKDSSEILTAARARLDAEGSNPNPPDSSENVFGAPNFDIPIEHTPEEIDAAIERVEREGARSNPPVAPLQAEEQKETMNAEPERRITLEVTDGIPEVRERYFGPTGGEIPRPGTPIDAGDGKRWVALGSTDERIRLATEDGTEMRDVPLAEFVAARRRAEEAERELMRETQEAVEKLSESERFSLGMTLERIRFDVSRGVAETASSVLGGISKVFSERPVGRFLGALSAAYQNRAEDETKKLEELEKARRDGTSVGAAYRNLANAGSIAANILKYGRIFADITGLTAAAPLRWVTLGAVVAKEATEAAKEARFTYDEVKEQTRIHDIDRAHEEAIALTERALKNKGLSLEDLADGKSLSAQDLQEAYREGLPKDLLERLQKEPIPGTGRGIVERMYRWYIGVRVRGIERKIEAIDAGPGDIKEKAAKKRELLLRFGRSKALNDFDRMLGEQGTLDRIAMGADIGSIVSTAAIYATMAQSVSLLFDRLAEALSENGIEVTPVGPTSDLVSKELADEAVSGVEELPRSAFEGAHAEWSAAEHAGAAAEHVPLPEYPVQVGDSTYKILREHVPAFRDLGSGRMREYAMAKFLSSLTPEQIRAAGFSSGNTQLIYPGERIDVAYLDHLARSADGGGESVIDQAIRRFGASEPVDVTDIVRTSVESPSEIREIVEPIVATPEMERLARESVREETLFRYIDGLIVGEDFQGNRDHWNAIAVGDARRFFETPQTTTEGVLLQKRLAALAQISQVEPASFESVHDFVDRAFRSFIERSGVEPKSGERISEYLERATDAYIRKNTKFSGER